MPGILELDKARIRRLASGREEVEAAEEDAHKGDKETPAAPTVPAAPRNIAPHDEELDSSEYEEVEVTDDEGEDGKHPSKRQRTDDAGDQGPVEFLSLIHI